MYSRLAVYPEKCTGCRLCETVCALYHNGVVAPSLARVNVVKEEEKGEDVPVFCQQCTRPVCQEVCPAGAITLDQELGITVIDQERCLGCRMCLMACPLGGITVTPEGRMLKCDLCGGDPQCAKYCPAGAIKYLPLTRMAHEKRRQGVQKLLELREQAV